MGIACTIIFMRFASRRLAAAQRELEAFSGDSGGDRAANEHDSELRPPEGSNDTSRTHSKLSNLSVALVNEFATSEEGKRRASKLGLQDSSSPGGLWEPSA